MTDVEFEQIFNENKKLVYLVIKKRFPTFMHDDDVIQSGYIGLWKAINTYDENKYAFSTYAYWCIYNEISMYFRNLKTHLPSEDKAVKEMVPMDALFHMVGDRSVNWVDIKGLLTAISEQERQIIILRLFGWTQKEIAEYVHITQAHVSRILKKMSSVINDYI